MQPEQAVRAGGCALGDWLDRDLPTLFASSEKRSRSPLAGLNLRTARGDRASAHGFPNWHPQAPGGGIKRGVSICSRCETSWSQVVLLFDLRVRDDEAQVPRPDLCVRRRRLDATAIQVGGDQGLITHLWGITGKIGRRVPPTPPHRRESGRHWQRARRSGWPTRGSQYRHDGAQEPFPPRHTSYLTMHWARATAWDPPD